MDLKQLTSLGIATVVSLASTGLTTADVLSANVPALSISAGRDGALESPSTDKNPTDSYLVVAEKRAQMS